MNSKKTILLFVIIVALAGAGVFAYFSFMGDSTPEPVVTAQSSGVGAILPKGTKLDFTTINKFNQTASTFNYPVVTPTETGLPLDSIISQ